MSRTTGAVTLVKRDTMTIEGAIDALDAPLGTLAQALDNLRWAAVQAQPAVTDGHALFDHYGAVADDLCALLAEARLSLAVARLPAARGDPAAAGRALLACQARCNRLAARFYGDAVAHEWREALNQLRRRGGEWATWVEGVVDALDHCPPPLYEVGEAQVAAWRAIVEGSPPVAVSVAAKTIRIGTRREGIERATDGGGR